MASRRPARTPRPRSSAACVSRSRHRAGRSRLGEQRRDAQVGRRARLQRFELRHAGAPDVRRHRPRSGGADGAASRRAAAQSTRNRPRPADRSSTIPSTAEDAAVACRQPERREVLDRGETNAARQVVGLGAEQGQKLAVRRAEVHGGAKDAVNAHRKFAARDVRSQRRGPPDSVSRRSHGRSREPP